MSILTGHRFIAEMLKGYEVTTVFHVPYMLDRALAEMGALGMKRVLCHSEKAAAYMADGYARASRRPGVVLAQSVGAANLAAGLQDAWLGCSPVIALTGRWPSLYLYRHAYQEIDHRPLYEPVTKFNAYVDSVESLPLLLRQAFREATTGAPGPVHLDLMGILGELTGGWEADLEILAEETFTRYPAFRPEPDATAVRQAAALLSKAKRPVLVAGGGATASGAGAEVVQLAEKLNLPVATSLNGKGLIPENHPLSVGVVGSYSRKCANQIVSEADLVLFVGSHTGGQVTNFWKIPKQGTPTIQIDIDPPELGRNYPAQVALLGDAKLTLQRLADAVEPGARPEWTAHTQQLVAQWRESFEPLLTSEAEPIRPERLCRELTDFLPSDAVLVSDTGHAGIWTGAMVELRHTSQRFLRCAGSLGWGFPAALGAKCALPDRPVICFTGDGGFWYHLSELETAARCGINTVTVIINNQSLNQCGGGFERASKEAGSVGADLWRFRDVSFADIARSMGCLGLRVERPSDLRSALDQALTADRPVVVEVVTDIEALAPTAYTPE